MFEKSLCCQVWKIVWLPCLPVANRWLWSLSISHFHFPCESIFLTVIKSWLDWILIAECNAPADRSFLSINGWRSVSNSHVVNSIFQVTVHAEAKLSSEEWIHLSSEEERPCSMLVLDQADNGLSGLEMCLFEMYIPLESVKHWQHPLYWIGERITRISFTHLLKFTRILLASYWSVFITGNVNTTATRRSSNNMTCEIYSHFFG